MPDYTKGKIYSIRSHHTDDIYIGSTCRTLCQRLATHRYSLNSVERGNKNKSLTSHPLLKLDDHYIELIENCPCNSKEELLQREGYYIRSMKCLNKKMPYRSEQEKKEYHQQWSEENKEHLKEYKKKWVEDNKEYVKEQHTEYAYENRDKIKQYQKKWAEDNKEHVQKIQKEKYARKWALLVECECGVSVARQNMKRHVKSKKHVKKMKKH